MTEGQVTRLDAGRSLNQTVYTVPGTQGGRGLARELEQTDVCPLQTLIRWTRGLLEELEAIHADGGLHLDINPDHVLLVGHGDTERVTLTDFNGVHSAREFQDNPLTCSSFMEGYTAPELRMGRAESISPASDLYSVAALWFRLLMGRPLSPLEMMRCTPPDISTAPCLKDMPVTVVSMVRRILRRGLAMLPGERYQSAARLRKDLMELSDRMTGAGITHSAIWDAGRRNIRAMVAANPSLHYLKDEEGLYPLRVKDEQGEQLPMGAWLNEILSGNGVSSLLIGADGTGKTTALMRLAYQMSERCAEDQPAVFYLSLYGWTPEDGWYIRNKLLDGMRFRADTMTFSNARHALGEWMTKPLRLQNSSRPALVLLLDGLNEAVGDLTPLIRELKTLSGLEGVRIILAGCAELPQLPFPRVKLSLLELSDVGTALAAHGLLMPESKAARSLLCMPLMLSIYISASAAAQTRPLIQTREELLAAYLKALSGNETGGAAENAPDQWPVRAALYYVLPGIARETSSGHCSLNERDLYRLVERCYRVLSAGRMRGAFPQWIGHGRDIRGGAGNAEEWYDLIVRDILWKRVGLMTRERDGSYRLTHQVLEEYLLPVEKENAARLEQGRRKRLLVMVICLVLTLLSGFFIYECCVKPKPYSTNVTNVPETIVPASQRQPLLPAAGDFGAFFLS